MAAVTVTKQATNVNGSFREKYFTVNIANSLDTLATGFKVIKAAEANDGAITKVAATLGTVTFTTTGAVTGALVRVTGF